MKPSPLVIGGGLAVTHSLVYWVGKITGYEHRRKEFKKQSAWKDMR